MKVKFYLFLLTMIFFVACSDDDKPVVNDAAIYKIELEASGKDYSANVHITNSDNISILDASTGDVAGQSSVDENFENRRIYVTSDKVMYISVQGVIISEVSGTLKMVVYRNGKEIYNETVSVPDLGNKTKSLYYTNINNKE